MLASHTAVSRFRYMVLPRLTIASHCQTTTWLVALTASMCAGRCLSTCRSQIGFQSGLTHLVGPVPPYKRDFARYTVGINNWKVIRRECGVTQLSLLLRTLTISSGCIVGPTLIPLRIANKRAPGAAWKPLTSGLRFP